MKAIKVLNFLVVLSLFLSCDKNNNTNQLVLNIDAVIQKTDSINVYYTKNKGIEFTDKQSFWTKVTGNKKNQNIKTLVKELDDKKAILNSLFFEIDQKERELGLKND